MDQKKIKKISRYGKFLLQATKVALNCLPMQISCEIYYMGKQLTLAEKALGAFPADACSSRTARRMPTAIAIVGINPKIE